MVPDQTSDRPETPSGDIRSDDEFRAALARVRELERKRNGSSAGLELAALEHAIAKYMERGGVSRRDDNEDPAT